MAGMKSAVELALEKLGKGSEQGATSLTDEQRQEISQLRKQYEAKMAEKDIMVQAEIRRLMQRRPPSEAAAKARELHQELQETKTALRNELEEKVAAVRSRQ
jgi:Spy/CpxP family protein refolding chaperone